MKQKSSNSAENDLIDDTWDITPSSIFGWDTKYEACF